MSDELLDIAGIGSSDAESGDVDESPDGSGDAGDISIHGSDIDRDESFNRYERVSNPADPRRCKANNAHGQCIMVQCPGSQYCILHGGKRKATLHNYNLSKWHMRAAELANSSGVKSLRDEVGILRMMLEERLNAITDVSELLVMSHAISELVLKIEHVVASCHKIERSMGNLIDRSDILTIVTQIIAIIETHIPDHATVERISHSIEQVITTVRSKDEDDSENS